MGGEGVLGDVAGGALAQGLDRDLLVAEGRDQDDRHLRVVVADVLDQLDARHAGHAQVGEDEVGLPPLERGQGLVAVAGELELQPLDALEVGTQEVAIARGLLLDAPVLIMDEPTNAMDNSTEEQFKSRLAAVLDGRTLLLVTHRASLLSLVTRVIVMDGGRVVADGPRDQVLEACPGQSNTAQPDGFVRGRRSLGRLAGRAS